MFSSLGMCEVGAVILVDCETQSTFEGADVVLEEVGIFVEIDGFESEFAETLASVSVCG